MNEEGPGKQGKKGEKLHYNAYEMDDFQGKCIIMQFLEGIVGKRKSVILRIWMTVDEIFCGISNK